MFYCFICDCRFKITDIDIFGNMYGEENNGVRVATTMPVASLSGGTLVCPKMYVLL